MTLLVQMTDTHIETPGKLLYGKVDTAVHLQESVREINAMQPQPDLVMVTGDLVETPSEASYAHFSSLIKPLRAPVYILPGNHDDPQLMLELYGDTALFPAVHSTLQYVIDDFPVRILALNSHFQGSELPDFGTHRLQWLQQTLAESDRPTLIAIHHPPMKTGIGFIDMVGAQWYAGIRDVIAQHAQVHLVIAGHGHTDLIGRIAGVPVYMAGSTAHQLIAARVHDQAPAFDDRRFPPVLHHWVGEGFVSGSDPWPEWVGEKRIDAESGLEWDVLKDRMRGSM
ncbi:MAG TPA: metallophosphoesterase [Xanthomonadales bacterium]|nr:metallophosphoesterase [Xanthomonadales bacterium]